MKRWCLSVVAIRPRAISFWIALLQALVLFASTSVLAQGFPRDIQTIDLDEQLDIRLNNSIQGEDRNQADSLLRLGVQAQKTGNLETAIANWGKAVELYQQIGDLEGLGLAYSYLGLTYGNLGRYQEAEDAFRRRLGVARTRRDFQGQIYALNNVGTVLLQRRHLDAAQQTFQEGLTIARSIRSEEGEGLSLSNLGLVAASAGDYLEAIRRYEAALALRRQVSDPVGAANTRNNLGDAYRAANQPRKALIAYQVARTVAENSRDFPNQFRSLRGIVQANAALNQFVPAFRAVNQYAALAQQQNNRRQLLYALRLSAELYKATGNMPEARRFYEKAIAVANFLGDTEEEVFLRNDLSQIIYSSTSN